MTARRLPPGPAPEDRPCYAQRPAADVVELVLPTPPSTNRLFVRTLGGGVVKSAAYRAWRRNALTLGALQRPGRRVGASDVSIWLPQTRLDTDNCSKALLDTCTALGVIADDGPRFIRNVSLIRDSSRSDCRLVFRPTDDFGIPF